MKDLAVHFGQLSTFVNDLQEANIGEATTKSLQTILTTKGDELELELALAMDMEVLCTTTFPMWQPSSGGTR